MKFASYIDSVNRSKVVAEVLVDLARSQLRQSDLSRMRSIRTHTTTRVRSISNNNPIFLLLKWFLSSGWELFFRGKYDLDRVVLNRLLSDLSLLEYLIYRLVGNESQPNKEDRNDHI